MARLIDRDFTRGSPGACLVFVSLATDDISANTLLMLAHAICKELGRRVLLVDARFGNQSLGISGRFGLTEHLGFSDAVQGLAKLEDLIRPTTVANVDVLPAGDASDWFAPVDRQKLKDVFDAARARYDFVLVQVGAPDNDTRAVLTAAEGDAAFLLALENHTYMRILDNCRKVLVDNGVKDLRVVLTNGRA